MATGTQIEVVMPQMGVSVSEGTITKWLKQVGEAVALDEPLLEISTDKVDTEVPSPGEGVVAQILVAEGETVDVGTVLAVIAPAGAASRRACRRGARPGCCWLPSLRCSSRLQPRPRRPQRRSWWPRATGCSGGHAGREREDVRLARSWRGSPPSTASTRARCRAPARAAA